MPKWQRGNFWQKAEMERSMEENVNDNTELQEEPDIFYGGYKEIGRASCRERVSSRV